MASHRTLAITCVRDEGPWLLDWIAHHQAAGFDHFLIASHDCADGTDALLSALDEAGIVSHVPFTPNDQKSYQWQATKLLSAHDLYTGADLAMFFDVDEYLVTTDDMTVGDLLPEGADAMPLRWKLFGNTGLSTWEDAPVSTRFTHSAPDDISLPLAHFFKTLHRPSAFRELGVHRPKGKKGHWISASLTPLPPSFGEAQQRIQIFGLSPEGEFAWLNHYSVRSIEEFVLKSKRGLPNHMNKKIGAGYWAERNFNWVEDRRIAPLLPAAAQKRAALAPYDTLHKACVTHHRAALAQHLLEKPVIEMMWQLELMAGSTPPSPEQLTAHLARLTQMNETS